MEAVQEASEAERQLAPKEAIAASGGCGGSLELRAALEIARDQPRLPEARYGAGLEWRQLHGRCFEAEDRGFTYKARLREIVGD